MGGYIYISISIPIPSWKFRVLPIPIAIPSQSGDSPSKRGRVRVIPTGTGLFAISIRRRSLKSQIKKSNVLLILYRIITERPKWLYGVFCSTSNQFSNTKERISCFLFNVNFLLFNWFWKLNAYWFCVKKSIIYQFNVEPNTKIKRIW